MGSGVIRRTGMTDTLEDALTQAIRRHMQGARSRVPDVYRNHLSGSRAIFIRHWQHWRDIPADLASLPRGLIRMGRKLARLKGPAAPPPLSRKEAALLEIIQTELLDLPGLQATLESVLREHSAPYAACEALLSEPTLARHLPEIDAFLARHLSRLSTPREGTRDLLVFMMIGVLGKSLSQKVVFGSALATGSAIASSVYLASQSWWGALWVQIAGIPTWVTLSGALSGVAGALLLAPLFAPLGEWLVNRWRGERYLEGIIDRIETNLLQTRADGVDFVTQLAGLAQFAPDLLALLRSFR